MSGQQMPDIREGDTLQPGMPVADVLDLSELEVVAKVGELDRANLHEGQDVTIQLDAVPDKQLPRQDQEHERNGQRQRLLRRSRPRSSTWSFRIDMKQLLTALGAKPAEVQRILETPSATPRKRRPCSAASDDGRAGGPRWRPGGPDGEQPAARRAAGAAGAPCPAAPCAATTRGAPQAPARLPAAARCRTPAGRRRRPAWTSAKLAAAPRSRRSAVTEEERARTPSCLRLPKRIRSWMCCCVPGLLADVEIIVEKIPERDPRSGAGRLREGRQADRLRAERGRPLSRSAPSSSPSAANRPW